jgi:YegS/Rv2252/BmrU family lipid kinase
MKLTDWSYFMLHQPHLDVAGADSPAGSPRSALIIFNPTAGKRRKRRLGRTLARLDALGIPYVVRHTTAAGDARSFARNAEGFTIVAVAGGDGTINEAANGLAARRRGQGPDDKDANPAADPALAVIPFGTANVLAAEIGFTDMTPEAAAEAIACGENRPAWFGVANGRVFCQMAGVGFDAHVVAGVDPVLKRRLGKLAYVVESARQLWRYRPRTYVVQIDGVRHVAASVVIANGRFYAGRFTCAADASIDSPDLKVCLFGRAGRRHVLRYAWGLFAGRLDCFADVTVVSGRNIRIEVRDGGNGAVEPVQGDGDIIGRLPVDISVAPARLGIVRPVRRPG